MIEWTILAVLVPLVIVPLVLLLGFAGCDPFEAAPPPPPVPPDPPVDLVATAVGENDIVLEWTHAGGVTFIVSVLDPDLGWQDNHGQTTDLVFTSPGRKADTLYFYRVRAVLPNGLESAGSNLAQARTWKWQTAYERALTASDAAFPGDCLVQRFDRTILAYTGTVRRLRLTLRGSANAANAPLAIAQLSISHAAPPGLPGNPAPDPWDSESLPVPLGPASLPGNGNPLTLPAVDFPLAPGRDLLVAFDISGTNASQTRRVTGGVGASACYSKANVAEALVENRTPTGWIPRTGMVYLVEKVEVLTG